MSRQANVLLLLALAGGVAYGRFGLPWFLASGSDEIGEEGQSTEPVLVAQAEIPAGTFLGKDRPEKLFSLQYTTQRGTPASAVHSMDQTRMKIVARALAQGDILSQKDLADTAALASTGVGGGHRTVTLLFASDAGRVVPPGTQVNVICRTEMQSLVVARDVRVLTSGMAETVPPKNYRATLALTPEYAERLIRAKEQGTLSLAPIQKDER
jgi:Flp pilus assembly protein CpaB